MLFNTKNLISLCAYAYIFNNLMAHDDLTQHLSTQFSHSPKKKSQREENKKAKNTSFTLLTRLIGAH